MNDEERYRAKFEDMGESEVRRQWGLKHFQGMKDVVAGQWLSERDRARSDDSQAEQTALARSAAISAGEAAAAARRQADAAEDANRKADTANTIAIIAMIAAVVAIAISIIALFLKV